LALNLTVTLIKLAVGLAAVVLIIYLGYVLWDQLPLGVPPSMRMIPRLIGLALFVVGWLLTVWARWALGSSSYVWRPSTGGRGAKRTHWLPPSARNGKHTQRGQSF
jgi:hypothetical protein